MNLCLYLTIHMKIKLHTTNNKQKKKKILICSNSNFFSSVHEMFISGIFKHVKNRGNLFPIYVYSRYVTLDKKLQYTSLLIKLHITPTSIFKNIRSQPFTTYSMFP